MDDKKVEKSLVLYFSTMVFVVAIWTISMMYKMTMVIEGGLPS